ncbi:PREDICTED: uncharacterized protein LOC105555758 [Vollenhovia emeryi]|uniref:uncharacterized protein LOC105555758 n=1 Tax=Vollenhovia emeryi TaxID=411798 RepID=UPI0005F364FD|nr:PREDICTED: uncharacterized protein LOC105555758 [Vollenhovia emeryi]
MSKNKHYASIEKKIFLEILKDFKHVIEVKKSDCSTLRDKETAWSEICKRYNESAMIFQERTVQQLKKLWTNMKQNQREILTKEKQARLATGGGPPPPETNIDPDVAIVAPHLLETAPILFSSNMTDEKINEMEEQTLNILLDNNWTTASFEHNNEANNTNKIQKGMENTIETSVYNENTIKIERIKQIMGQEKEVAEIQKAHEEKMAAMKEDFHKEIHALEIRAATAKAELAELQLKKEKEKYVL